MRPRLNLLRGMAFCICAAVVLSLLMNDDPDVRTMAPFICLFAVTMAAFLWGRITAILGAIGAGVTFCYFLFPPLGSIRVANPHQRVAIVTFLLLAILAVRLAPPAVLVESSYSRARKRNTQPKKR